LSVDIGKLIHSPESIQKRTIRVVISIETFLYLLNHFRTGVHSQGPSLSVNKLIKLVADHIS